MTVDREELGRSFPVGDPREVLLALLKSTPDHVLWLDDDYRIRGSNGPEDPEKRRELLGLRVVDLLPPPEREEALLCYERARASGTSQHFRARASDAYGQSAIYETTITPLGRPGAITGFVILSRNVTGTSRREWNLELAVRATGMGIWRYEFRSGRIEWNAQMHEITGQPVPLDPESYVRNVVHPEERESVRSQLQRCIDTGVFDTISYRIVRPDGAPRWVMMVGQMERDARGETLGAQGIALDVTEQKRQERALLTAQRLEAVGQLAAGIAHNFNNLLCVIVPALEQWERTTDESRLGLVQDARLAAERAAGLVQQLVSFARLSHEDLRPYPLGRLLDDAVRMSRRIVGDVLDFEVDCQGHECTVFGGEGPLEQALVNLVVNARDAIVDDGRAHGHLRVDCRVEGVEDLPPSLRGASRFARIRVSDDGPGMAPEVRDRVFDPFFTTKAPGRGTGLGLSTAYATVARLGGRIECQSTPGLGTTFSLFVPLGDGPEFEASTGSAPRPTEGGHSLRVLVVDDEDIVRRALVNVLEQGGLQVLGVRNSAEALEVVRRREFDVALVDRTMPGMDGIGLAGALRVSHPALRLVLVTGSEVSPSEGVVFDQVLTKPVRSAALLEVVRSLGPQPRG